MLRGVGFTDKLIFGQITTRKNKVDCAVPVRTIVGDRAVGKE